MRLGFNLTATGGRLIAALVPSTPATSEKRMSNRKSVACRQPFARSMILVPGLILGIIVSDNVCPTVAAEDSTTGALEAARAAPKADSENLRSASRFQYWNGTALQTERP